MKKKSAIIGLIIVLTLAILFFVACGENGANSGAAEFEAAANQIVGKWWADDDYGGHTVEFFANHTVVRDYHEDISEGKWMLWSYDMDNGMWTVHNYSVNVNDKAYIIDEEGYLLSSGKIAKGYERVADGE